MGLLDAVVELVQRRAPSFGSHPLSLTEWVSARMTQAEMEYHEETRQGLTKFFAPKNGVTGIAPVQAIPTTAAQWVLWNKDPYNTICLDELGVYLVSGTAGAGVVLLATPFQTPDQTATSMNAGMGVWSGNGDAGGAPGAATSTSLIIAASVTLTQPAAPYWYPIADNSANATAVGEGICANRLLKGKLMLPPKCGLALAVVSPTGTTPLFAPFGKFTEKFVTNER